MALPNAVSGSLSSATNSQGNFFTPINGNGLGAPANFNLEVRGTFVAVWAVQRSLDDGANWVNITNLGSALSFTGPMSETLIESQGGVRYAIIVTSYTSGTLNYKFSQ